MNEAAKYHPKAMQGKIRLVNPPLPATGSTLRYNPNTIRSTSANQKLGMDNPSKAIILARLSHHVLSLTADRMPRGIPTTMAKIRAPAASWRDAEKRWKYKSRTGRLNWNDWPMSPLNTLLMKEKYCSG